MKNRHWRAINFFWLLLAGLSVIACGPHDPAPGKQSGQSAGKGNIEIHYLPGILNEISGITVIDSNVVACIQDEKGIVFLYDRKTEKIIREIEFAPDGDFEDICRVGDVLYILRSDGCLFEIEDFTASTIRVQTYPVSVPSENCEGLCYDAPENRLLIASRVKPVTGKGSKELREVFAFDLLSKKIASKKPYTFNSGFLEDFAIRNNIPIPVKTKKDGTSKQKLEFRPSAIAIQPVTQKLFVLSADDYMLFIFSKAGEIERIIPLDPAIFVKAEGLTFDEGGCLFISNEGITGKASLLRLKSKNSGDFF